MPAIDLRFIAGYDQSQSNRGDEYRNKGFSSSGGGGRTKNSQSSGGYGGQGGDTQGYGGGAYGGGDQCIPSFPEVLAWNTEMAFLDGGQAQGDYGDQGRGYGTGGGGGGGGGTQCQSHDGVNTSF